MTQAPNQPADSEGVSGEGSNRQDVAYDVSPDIQPDLTVFEDSDAITLETLFEALAEPGGRYVLTALLRADAPVTTSELVEFVVDRTNPSTTRSAFRSDVADALTHVLLPNLAEAGLVEYDVERQVVARTDRTANALPYLQIALEQRRVQDPASD